MKDKLNTIIQYIIIGILIAISIIQFISIVNLKNDNQRKIDIITNMIVGNQKENQQKWIELSQSIKQNTDSIVGNNSLINTNTESILNKNKQIMQNSELISEINKNQYSILDSIENIVQDIELATNKYNEILEHIASILEIDF